MLLLFAVAVAVAVVVGGGGVVVVVANCCDLQRTISCPMAPPDMHQKLLLSPQVTTTVPSYRYTKTIVGSRVLAGEDDYDLDIIAVG